MNARVDAARGSGDQVAFALGCRVNSWVRKAFSSKNFAYSRMKDWAVVSQLALLRTNEIDVLLSSEGNVQLVNSLRSWRDS